ncbi:MAG TPA: signal peptidase II [Acidobacteriota bacterium]|nr:signal peptidase II [Acidobacteriota bacterium]
MNDWRMRSQYLLISIAVFLLDQISKQVVAQGMVQHQSIEVIRDFLSISYIHNRGAVFGLGSTFATPYLSWMLSLLSVVSLIVILVYFLRVNATNRRLYTGLSLVLGGAMGNLFDRLKNKYVVDFIDLHWFQYHWPTFNLADSAICIGVGLLLLSMASSPEHTSRSNAI